MKNINILGLLLIILPFIWSLITISFVVSPPQEEFITNNISSFMINGRVTNIWRDKFGWEKSGYIGVDNNGNKIYFLFNDKKHINISTGKGEWLNGIVKKGDTIYKEKNSKIVKVFRNQILIYKAELY